jgi:ATP-dependent Clp protease protease subunit
MNKIMQLLKDNALFAKQPINLIKNADEATLYIYDVISADWGISAQMVIDAIANAAGVPILNIRINSPGGDVFEARAIIEAIKRFEGKTIAHIDAIAASAATGIACAANEVLMAEGAFYMIHNAQCISFGDKNAMRETADLLEKIEGSIVADYTAKTCKEPQQIIEWMNAETWFSAKEAIDNGFADGLAPTATKPKNMWNLSAYSKTPDALKNTAPPPEPTQQIETEKPAPAGFLMSVSNANRLRLVTAL